jgi:hypothetical protein
VEEQFDILKVLADGSEQQVDKSESFGAALFCVELAGRKSPGRYIILNRISGERNVVTVENPREGRPLKKAKRGGL